MTDIRRPLHLVVLVGASTAVYAASLAGVAAFQSADDRALTERQAPAADAVTRLRDGHDGLEATIGRAADAYSQAAAGYDALTPRIQEAETALDQLAERVHAIGGTAQALPGRVSLPPISRSVITTTGAKPKTSGSTGASGG
jgi:hypothetical protein